MRTIKLVIADDHPYFLLGLKTALGKLPGIKVIGEAADGNQLCTLVRSLRPDVMMTDIVMPNMDGIEATRILHREFPKMGIMALSVFDQPKYVVRILEAGANGFLVKTASLQELREAIREAYMLRGYFGKSSGILCRMIAESNYETDLGVKKLLSDKEIEIIKLVCLELTSKEIAGRLGYTTRTVETYRSRIQDKLGVKGTAGMVVFAIRSGMHDPY